MVRLLHVSLKEKGARGGIQDGHVAAIRNINCQKICFLFPNGIVRETEVVALKTADGDGKSIPLADGRQPL